jgi:hypothetical protein
MKKLILAAVLLIFLAIASANAAITTTVTVLSPPIIVDATVQPANPDTSQDLLCNATIIDISEPKIEYSWLKNGLQTDINTQILPKTFLKNGDEWTCIIKTGNQYGESSANYTTKIIIASQITGKFVEEPQKNSITGFFEWISSLFRF